MIKPKPLIPVVPGGFTLDDFTIDDEIPLYPELRNCPAPSALHHCPHHPHVPSPPLSPTPPAAHRPRSR